MKTVGIICEYNPFHNGHLYHLEKAKEIADGGNVIAILTGYFSMRGDISVLNKYDKVKTAIDNGINITMELPYLLGTQNADLFAYNSVYLLNEMKIDTIVCGSELNNIDILKGIPISGICVVSAIMKAENPKVAAIELIKSRQNGLYKYFFCNEFL